MNGGLIMGRQSKLRQLRRLQKNNDVLGLNYSTCSNPSEAYRLLFQHNTSFTIGVWTHWRQSYDPNHPQFMVFESNLPDHPEPRVTIRPGNELKQLGQQLNLPPRELDLQGYIVDPDELERFRIPPPTIVVLHDGLPDGDCVSQFLRCKYQ
jgi:hypothetical protein